MGRGLVEPLDDLRPTNPGDHPAALDWLSAEFVRAKYDLRALLRTIVLSSAYRRGGGLENASPHQRYFARASARPLPPEVWLDAIGDVTGVSAEFPSAPAGARAVSLVSPRSAELDVLGRCDSGECAAATSDSAAGLAQGLHLVNGPLLNARITDPGGRLAKLLAAGQDNDAIVREFYAHAYGRAPRPSETEYWQKQLASADDAERRQKLEDFVWAILSSREFTTSH
jgi:hypothetical protein